MERQEKGGSTYFFLALVTLAFLAAVLYLTFGANRTEQEGYTVQTERPAREEEIAPVRVLVNINTATAEELETVTGIGPVLAQAILDYRAEHGDFQTLDEQGGTGVDVDLLKGGGRYAQQGDEQAEDQKKSKKAAFFHGNVPRSMLQ